ncbi:MAG: hypothetical protein BV459_06775 [Thermoplasmata archaeon M11B2D]|nr:MAG: hypothetical protein BV459_06775 [Thermoplasmata archaeon M11B2D]
MPELVIIRGLPGSGKSTIAKKDDSFDGYAHFEADMYFLDDTGQYLFDPAKLKEAHEWCFAAAQSCLIHGRNVVVCNTFSRLWEMQRYLDLGFPTKVIKATGNYRNVHGVPNHTIENMRARWEDYDGEVEYI